MKIKKQELNKTDKIVITLLKDITLTELIDLLKTTIKNIRKLEKIK